MCTLIASQVKHTANLTITLPFCFSARRAAKEAKEAPAQPAPVSLYLVSKMWAQTEGFIKKKYVTMSLNRCEN